MNLFKDFKPLVNVNEAEYKRLLGYPYDHRLQGKARELAGWAKDWYKANGKPWVYSILYDNLKIENDVIKIENIVLSSAALYNQFKQTGTDKAVLVVASAGKECEQEAFRLWEEDKPDEYFFLEVYGSAVVENLVSDCGYFLCDWAEKYISSVLPHYSPGYTGWEIEDQHKLWKLVEDYKRELPGELHLLDSGMMNPKKSMLALFGITSQIEKTNLFSEYIPCKSCSFTPCSYRRSPYKFWSNEIVNIDSLQSGFHLNHKGKYTINSKALQKWTNERLNLKINENGSINAVFHYEGTTCSNLGHKLEFEYSVKLGSSLEGYPIVSLNCTPSDEGYQFMCGYIRDNRLLSEISNEKPLLGEPLEKILDWKREYSPEGCYCNHESRSHKWGIVLEVLHFALVQYENKSFFQNKLYNNLGELIID